MSGRCEIFGLASCKERFGRSPYRKARYGCLHLFDDSGDWSDDADVGGNRHWIMGTAGMVAGSPFISSASFPAVASREIFDNLLVSREREPMPRKSPHPPLPGVRGRRCRITISAALVAFGMSPLTACGGDKVVPAGHSPETEIRQSFDAFTESAQKGEFNLFKNAVCSKTRQASFANVTDSAFSSSARETVAEVGWYVVDWYDEVKISGNNADITVSGHREGGTADDVGMERKTASLVLEDGSWKVCTLPTDDPETRFKREQAKSTSAIQSSIVNFYTAVGAQDLPAAKLLLCREQQGLDAAEFDTVAGLIGQSIASFDEIEVNGASGKAKVTTTGPNAILSVAFGLSREDDAWKVCAISPLARTLK